MRVSGFGLVSSKGARLEPKQVAGRKSHEEPDRKRNRKLRGHALVLLAVDGDGSVRAAGSVVEGDAHVRILERPPVPRSRPVVGRDVEAPATVHSREPALV